MSEAQMAEATSLQPENETDTDSGTPGTESVFNRGKFEGELRQALEAEADGAEATTETDNEESDTDDGTPDDEESEEGGYEQRYKDTQAKLTETSQQLSDLKSEYSQSIGQITDARLELEEKLSTVGQQVEFWENVAQYDLQQLGQVNVQQLNQEQYAQWQQQVQAANARAAQVNAAREQYIQQAKAARDEALKREVTVSRSVLTRTIDNFDEVYQEIGQFAVDNGVNPRVFHEITDPGLIRLLHKAMSDAKEPDAIEKVVTKTQAKKRPARSADGRFASSKPKSLAEKLYGD